MKLVPLAPLASAPVERGPAPAPVEAERPVRRKLWLWVGAGGAAVVAAAVTGVWLATRETHANYESGDVGPVLTRMGAP
jgi:ferric-dicitrate binding protein FerR (iron transport regulator)